MPNLDKYFYVRDPATGKLLKVKLPKGASRTTPPVLKQRIEAMEQADRLRLRIARITRQPALKLIK